MLPITQETMPAIRAAVLERIPLFANRVAPMYAKLDHQWPRYGRVPTESEIAEMAEHMVHVYLNDADSGIVCVSAGGILIEAFRWSPNSVDVRLRYVPEQVSCGVESVIA